MTKNCLLILKNKKFNDFESYESIISTFSRRGHFFDKIAYVAYDSSKEIISAVSDGLVNFEKFIIICPKTMENTLKSFIFEKTGLRFDETNFLCGATCSVYMMFSESGCSERVNAICSDLDSANDIVYEKAFVKTVGATAREINEAIAAARSVCDSLSIYVNEKYGECTIEIIYSRSVTKALFDSAYREIIKRLEKNIYALTDDTLEQRLVDLLKLRRLKLSVAESFTGGGICKRLVEIPGVSKVFFEGLNTYDNLSKEKRLYVDEETLHRRGAVSKETAELMACGLLKTGDCNVAIATTGIAGPKSDNTKKPVGLVYIAVGVEGNVEVYEYNLKGTRRQITETAINLALFRTFKAVK